MNDTELLDALDKLLPPGKEWYARGPNDDSVGNPGIMMRNGPTSAPPEMFRTAAEQMLKQLAPAQPNPPKIYTGPLEPGKQLRWNDQTVTIDAIVTKNNWDAQVQISWYAERPAVVKAGDDIWMARVKHELTLIEREFREKATEPVSMTLQGCV